MPGCRLFLGDFLCRCLEENKVTLQNIWLFEGKCHPLFQTLPAGCRSSISKTRHFWTAASTTGPSTETRWGLEPKAISQALTPKSPRLEGTQQQRALRPPLDFYHVAYKYCFEGQTRVEGLCFKYLVLQKFRQWLWAEMVNVAYLFRINITLIQ